MEARIGSVHRRNLNYSVCHVRSCLVAHSFDRHSRCNDLRDLEGALTRSR